MIQNLRNVSGQNSWEFDNKLSYPHFLALNEVRYYRDFKTVLYSSPYFAINTDQGVLTEIIKEF